MSKRGMRHAVSVIRGGNVHRNVGGGQESKGRMSGDRGTRVSEMRNSISQTATGLKRRNFRFCGRMTIHWLKKEKEEKKKSGEEEKPKNTLERIQTENRN
jgi:hypothetical protein